jgi:integration host factor subunit beta
VGGEATVKSAGSGKLAFSPRISPEFSIKVENFAGIRTPKRLDTKSNLPLQLRLTRHCSKDGVAAPVASLGGELNVTKKEIVKSISDEIGLTQLKTKEIVQKTFDAIIETLVADHRIELRNFGVFEVKKRAARKARNPRTGERVDVAEKWVVTFKPGKEMEERVRQLEQEAADAAARAAAGSAPTPEPAHHA